MRRHHPRSFVATAWRILAVAAIVVGAMGVRWDVVVAPLGAQLIDPYRLKHGKCDICWNCPGCPGYEAPEREPRAASGGGGGCATLFEAMAPEPEPEPEVSEAERRAAQARATYAVGYRAWQAGDLAGATAAMGEAHRANPGDNDIRTGYAIALSRQGDAAASRGDDVGAKQRYLEALVVHPSTESAVDGLDRLAERAGAEAAANHCGYSFTPPEDADTLLTGLESDPLAAGLGNIAALLRRMAAEGARWDADARDFTEKICRAWERDAARYAMRREAFETQCASDIDLPELAPWCARRHRELTAWYADVTAREAFRRAEAERLRGRLPGLFDRWEAARDSAREALNPSGLEGAFRLLASEMQRQTLRRATEGPALTDCEAMARMMGALHRRTGNSDVTTDVAMRVLASEANPLVENAGPSIGFGGTGFRPEFTQSAVSNQVRHFVGYLGAALASRGILAIGRTELTDIGPTEEPDKALAYYAVDLARRVRDPARAGSWSNLETTLRAEVCAGPPTQ